MELVRAGQQNHLPTLMGGDFNILRNSKEKNNERYSERWPFLFNVVIDSFDLREVKLLGRQFTWANSLPNPTYEKLDRALMSSEWDFKYPLVIIHALDRGVSDHTPLLLDTGTSAFVGCNRQFKLELSWISCEEFNDKVIELWKRPAKGKNSVQRWNNKLSTLRRYLRGWERNKKGIYRQQKAACQDKIIDLDVADEKRDLNEEEQHLLAQSRDQLAALLREEEIRFYQRAKTNDILFGDRNTRYFQMVANGKKRKKKIFSLDHGQGKIEGQENLKKYITNFYKELFGPPEINNFSLEESWTSDILQVSPIENEILIAPFSEREIREAIFSMDHNKAPGPDGFPAEFYQHFWDIIKEDLMYMFEDLSKGELPLFSLNFGVITLIPKVQEANLIQQYRPICLLNESFKIFNKVAAIRLKVVADHVINPSQTAFMKERNILQGVIILHETIHELHKQKLDGILRMKGFSPKWIKWGETFISGGSVAVNVNDEVGRFFQTKKGLRQGDPLFPLLFNIVADMLAILIKRAKMDGQIRGIVPHLVDGGLSILQYADDTIIFLDHDIEMARNMKLILCAFEQLSGLKINFNKSEIYCFGNAQNNLGQYMEMFGCRVGEFRFNYLGIPIHFKKLRNKDWKKVEERFEKRLSSWKGKHLSIGGRLTLLSQC
ncbi:hypothetical protein U9M48_037961 [Paspalum notatum var. saurae]|uniref:Reverse transcriptase domain-containing protein n=1 Tax=Paspalum notatum var. saurae TaxID=547442 RepID=A0AAQ3UIB0_PASNO